MTSAPNWISKKALLLLHAESLASFGGAGGMRDEGLLDSALARPEDLYAYQPDCTLADLAAAYAFGLTKNHALVDGNKRVGFLSIGVFLAINGHRLTASPLDAIRMMLAVAAGELGEGDLSQWIAHNMAVRSEPVR